jgi:hypothetical protein
MREANIILFCVRWYLRYSLSYRDLEELILEPGSHIDHTTIYRWVQRYAPELEKRCRPHRHRPQLIRGASMRPPSRLKKSGCTCTELWIHRPSVWSGSLNSTRRETSWRLPSSMIFCNTTINLVRIVAWLDGDELAPTRVSAFERLYNAA